MTSVVAIRPEPGLASTLKLAAEMGLDVVGQPLFEIRSLPWDGPDPAGIDALLIGSANAILHGGESLGKYLTKPVHAVGETTAQAAREAGFAIAQVGTGGLQTVLDSIQKPLRMLRIAGAEHVDLTPPHEITIETAIAYESVPLALDPDLLAPDGDNALVMLHSAAAARHFAQECDRLGLNRGVITLAVLGPRIAEAAGAGWKTIHIAPRPSDSALLEMIQHLCV